MTTEADMSERETAVAALLQKFDGATEGSLVHEWYGASHGREVHELTQADRELIVSALKVPLPPLRAGQREEIKEVAWREFDRVNFGNPSATLRLSLDA